jgi:hypothetical protein
LGMRRIRAVADHVSGIRDGHNLSHCVAYVVEHSPAWYWQGRVES